ncbi:MAG TPA: DUF4148 domain-containing protein [Burkholderiaceae bacterium]|nr:DUF4148 domain-containing protein [Burkholderiaceae bacterium]
MKTLTRLSIAAAVLSTLSLSTPAFAQEATQFDFSAVPSTRTRAEVNAEVLRARADGTLPSAGEATEFAFNAVPSTLTRAQVVAEAIEAKRLGLLDHGEVNPRSPTPAEQRLIAEAGRRAVERLHSTIAQQ